RRMWRDKAAKRRRPGGGALYAGLAPFSGDRPMARTLHIDFISDIVCPWCVVGLGGLTAALERLKGEGIEAQVRFQPFELNPQMPPEGENIVEHIGRKYGSTPEQSARNRAMITERAAEAWPGFEMRMGEDSRI